jgi:hypothetical protein
MGAGVEAVSEERIADLERRVASLEEPKRSWLDEPATLNGEPIMLGDDFPLGVKIFLWLFGGAILLCVLLVGYAGLQSKGWLP